MRIRRLRAGALAAGAALPALVGVAGLYHPTVVVGSSMVPALRPGQVVWTDRTCYRFRAPQPGDVILFRVDGELCIKRVYRGPGERLFCVVAHGDALVPIPASAAEEVRRRWTRTSSVREIRVPADAVFVLGDNQLRSIDSRTLGPIPLRSVLGRVRVGSSLEPLRRLEFHPPPPPDLASARSRKRDAAPP